jgi:hypothetical protein
MPSQVLLKQVPFWDHEERPLLTRINGIEVKNQTNESTIILKGQQKKNGDDDREMEQYYGFVGIFSLKQTVSEWKVQFCLQKGQTFPFRSLSVGIAPKTYSKDEERKLFFSPHILDYGWGPILTVTLDVDDDDKPTIQYYDHQVSKTCPLNYTFNKPQPGKPFTITVRVSSSTTIPASNFPHIEVQFGLNSDWINLSDLTTPNLALDGKTSFSLLDWVPYLSVRTDLYICPPFGFFENI